MFGATAVRQKREREKRDKIARGLKVRIITYFVLESDKTLRSPSTNIDIQGSFNLAKIKVEVNFLKGVFKTAST